MPKEEPFSSEGFDLDALVAAVPGSTDVIYELGGKVTTSTNVSPSTDESNNSSNNKTNDNIGGSDKNLTEHDKAIESAENFKKMGNDAFLKHQWQEAFDMYTKAIEVVPYDDIDNSVNIVSVPLSYRGEQLIKMQEDWEKEQYKLARQRLQEKEETERLKRRQQQQQKETPGSSDDKRSSDTPDNDTNKDDKVTFQPPKHLYGDDLAVYYCNRAAARLQLDQESPSSSSNSQPSTNKSGSSRSSSLYEKDEECIQNPQLDSAVEDCTIAVLLKPEYVKAFVRRATGYERLNKTDKALKDMKSALSILDGTKMTGTNTNTQQYKTIQQSIRRLQKMEDERLEKLKTETLGKLKDLGNSILGNFGMSLDNFQAKQDPKTGSYNISYNNNNK